jgi:hypothetical protein
MRVCKEDVMVYRHSNGLLILVLCLVTAFGSLHSIQGQVLVDKNKGSHFVQQLKGYMDGNLVGTVYYSYGEVADWENEPSRSGVWPKGTNHTYVDGVAMIVQAEAHVPDPANPSKTITFHPLETHYYEFTRYDLSTGVTYGWWPLPGYAALWPNLSPAVSNDPATWPPHWPDRYADWDGYWNGYFGKGVQNADLETFFVYDDNEDREYVLKYNYQPDADDTSRGGLGMQVKARGFQWSQVLAEDVIFWHYEITNMTTTDYQKSLFAEYVDWGIGGHDNSSNNAGDYNKLLNISYAWSTVPYGSPGSWSPVGMTGYAFLESPGIPDDNRDNDLDGLTDERRDNEAKVFVTDPYKDPFLRDVQHDTAQFRTFYSYAWSPHWDADENCNWRPWTDLNENGVWDQGEQLNDDVGSDGIGPFDEGYTGPDPDGTEANGRPDEGEPNFGITDKDESDQLGLTGFKISAVHTYELHDDEANWAVLSGLPDPHGGQLVGVNLANHFSSYLFSLLGKQSYSLNTGRLQETGETERFSMALIFGMDLDDLFRRKRTVQQIYNASYRFAKPPEKPMVKAIAGDQRVTLYWDDRAERTFDAFYQKYNFEGYRVYRSTEANFLEDKIITDAYGKSTYRKPIAQFDLVDGVTGLHPVDVNGALFYLGDDTGLQHTFIDSTVQNGQTYYYAVVSYDQGFSTTTVQGEFLGIPPSECTSIVKVDINGRIKTDVNTAVVIPRAPAAGYVAPQLPMIAATGPGTGSVTTQILDPDSMRDNHTYKVAFVDSSAFHNASNPLYTVLDMTNGDTLIGLTRMPSAKVVTPVMHGFSVTMLNDQSVNIDRGKTGWTTGSTNYVTEAGFNSTFGGGALAVRRVDYPADFEIRFMEPGKGSLALPRSTFSPPNPSNIIVKNITENRDSIAFVFYDQNGDSTLGSGEAIFIAYGDSAGKPPPSFSRARFTWSLAIEKDTTLPDAQQRPPQPGDVYLIATSKPFRTGEYYGFQSSAPKLDEAKAITDLANVAVVPNPYAGAASWEPATTSVGRGERRVYFIHLPRTCTIRIYTIAGRLVRTLEHDSSIDDGQEAWNLVSRDGMDIAYGIYVYHVDAPGLGTTIGKLAVLK